MNRRSIVTGARRFYLLAVAIASAANLVRFLETREIISLLATLIGAVVLTLTTRWARDRGYDAIYALKTRLAALPDAARQNIPLDINRFAFEGFAHSHKYCCGYTEDGPCGGCGCYFGMMYPHATFWDEILYHGIRPVLRALRARVEVGQPEDVPF